MRIVNPKYFDYIEIDQSSPETIVMENPVMLRNAVTELIAQCNGDEGAYVISENNLVLPIPKNICLITDLFHLDFDEKGMKTRIQSHVADICFDSQRSAQLVTDIKKYAYELCEETLYPTVFNTDFTITDLIKFLNFRFYPDSEAFIETIADYIYGLQALQGKKLIITLSLKDYFELEEYKEFIKQMEYKNIALLMLERHMHQDLDDVKHLRIIDKDLCVI